MAKDTVDVDDIGRAGRSVELPLRGLGMGQQLRWLLRIYGVHGGSDVIAQLPRDE